MFTDEISMPLGLQDLIHNVTRLSEEKWNDYCCVSDFKKPIQLQFYRAIAYNWKGPCHIFEIETETERAISIAALQESHKTQYFAEMKAFGVKALNYHMAKG
jgi:hypothetical protein